MVTWWPPLSTAVRASGRDNQRPDCGAGSRHNLSPSGQISTPRQGNEQFWRWNNSGFINDLFPQQEQTKEGTNPGPEAAAPETPGTEDKTQVGSESPAEVPTVSDEGKEDSAAAKNDSQTDDGQQQSQEERLPLSEAAEKKVEDQKEILSDSTPDSQTVQVIEDKDNDEGKEEAVAADEPMNVSEDSKKKPGEINELPSVTPPAQQLIPESAMDEH